MNRKIIGVTGVAGSGKDTFALAIKSSEPKTDIFAFASPLKEACKILFNFSHDQLHHPVVKEEMDERWEKSPRQILQWLGTDILRTHINQDFFVLNMKQRIDSSEADYILISDVRFDNEAEFIRSLGGKVIKIVSEGSETTKHSGHITERGISAHLIDAVVENKKDPQNREKSIEEFQNRVRFVVNDVLFKKEEPIQCNHSNHFSIE